MWCVCLYAYVHVCIRVCVSIYMYDAYLVLHILWLYSVCTCAYTLLPGITIIVMGNHLEVLNRVL